MGRLTALSKQDGGVKGIVAGDVVRRLVASTVSRQLSPAVGRAFSPYQYAMTTRAGGLTEIDPQVTVTSIDGLGSHDMISRGAMLREERLRCSTHLHAHVLPQKFRVLVRDGQW